MTDNIVKILVKEIIDKVIHNVDNSSEKEIDSLELVLSKLSINKETKKCVHVPDGVIDGSLFTKEKRNELFGVIAGGAGSMKPENYQHDVIVRGTGVECSKTGMRINLRTNILKVIAFPNVLDHGYDYSENFDRVQNVGDKTIYINLKCIVGKGGSQTRSLREVYWFIQGQIQTLASDDYANIHYANILDGDEAHNAMPKFRYVLSLCNDEKIRNRIYIGDTKGYFGWFKKITCYQ